MYTTTDIEMKFQNVSNHIIFEVIKKGLIPLAY